jgi:hypothetical protein
MNTLNRWARLSDLALHMAYRQEWMPLAEAAILYRVTTETMIAWVRQQRFRSCEIESSIWVSRDELESALRRRPVSATHSGICTHSEYSSYDRPS